MRPINNGMKSAHPPVAINTEGLVKFQDGRFQKTFDDKVTEVLKDVDDRPHEQGKRTLTCTFTFEKPTGDDGGVMVGFEVQAKVPKLKSNLQPTRITRTKNPRTGEVILGAQYTPEVSDVALFDDDEPDDASEPASPTESNKKGE